MRNDRLYLIDIVEAVESINRFLDGMDAKAFHKSELHQSGVLQKLTLVGEAAARISVELRDQHPEVPWRDIVSFRNIAVHEYFAVDWSIVWTAATKNAPELRELILKVLEFEFPE